MAAKQRTRRTSANFDWEYGKLVPRAVIRAYARQIAERFKPDKIILFGSYAYGEPHKDSDVDILVVMPAKNHISQAVKIRMALPDPPFSLDLIVRAPGKLQRRLQEGDSLLGEIVGKGKVLYEKGNGAVGSQGRR
jgi:predicted nucleotidyltransferase